ncbi:hypothetical protein [Cypionkella sp. TWP1-2-1b2]|uniref:hypothetical protein n=1 Tax=Cypionkella sp. TWP1-2-1b2 TaxID=2804675 RepID=UPI003CE8424E
MPAANFQSVNADGWSNTYASPPTFAPNVTPESFTVSRQGFDITGAAITVAEDMICTQRIRQPYPSQASLTTNLVAMSDYVYSTDTISGVTNNSTEISPKPITNWALTDHRVVGNTVHLEVVGFHRNARDREEIACVEFSATDGTTTVTQKVSTSIILGHPGDQFPVIGYACDLNISTLANPATVTCNAKVYPWIGGPAAVADSAASSVAREFSPRVYLRNTTLAANPVYVYVNATTGNDTTGAVSTTAATAEAAPCLTIAGAINRLHGVNTSVDGCIIRLMAGTHVFATTAIVATRTQSVGELIITRDPNTTRAAAIVQYSSVRPRLGAAGGWLRYSDVSIQRTSTGTTQGETASILKLTFESVNYDNGTNNATALSNSDAQWLGVVFSNVVGCNSFTGASTRENRMYRGVIATLSQATTLEGWFVVGSLLTTAGSLSFGTRSASGAIVAFNKFSSAPVASTFSVGSSSDVIGAAFVQNIVEYVSATSNTSLFLCADAATGNTQHVVIHSNTFTGFYNNGRSNLFYDEGATPRTNKLHSVRGNIHVQVNTKGDVFVTNGARVGNWAYLYGVGCEAEFSQFIDAGNGGLGTSFAQAYAGLAANLGTSPTARNDPLFVSNQGTTSGPMAGAGGGNYALQAGSPCAAKVKRPPLRFDMAGATRSATLATIGAYEIVVSNIVGTASGTIGFTGAAQGAAPALGASSGGVAITGAAQGIARADAQAAGAVAFTGAASGVSIVVGAAAGSIAFAGASAGAANVNGAASGTLPLTGAAAAITGAASIGAASGLVALSGMAAGLAPATGAGAGAISLTGQSQGIAPAAAMVAGVISFAGSGQAAALARGASTGALAFAGVSLGMTIIVGSASGAVNFTGTARAGAVTAGAIAMFRVPAFWALHTTTAAWRIYNIPAQWRAA